MSRVVELENAIEELEEQIRELQHELELEKQQPEIEHPLEIDDMYYVIDGDGEIGTSWWKNDYCDRQRSSVGNIFYTKQEAEKELDKRTLLTRFRQFRDKCNGDWKPDNNENKYYVYLLKDKKLSVAIDRQCSSLPVFGYFKNERDCLRAIELFSDEIKRLFVEEE